MLGFLRLIQKCPLAAPFDLKIRKTIRYVGKVELQRQAPFVTITQVGKIEFQHGFPTEDRLARQVIGATASYHCHARVLRYTFWRERVPLLLSYVKNLNIIC
ncbi:hypothetical protein ASG93_19095 [Paenibacillus sp. Soil787]|nr:hypothetical protein ASG93_19095 [Paenibacillus sp. Soil787]